MMGQKP